VFRSPINADDLMVKRITGVAGDLVESNQGKLIVPRDCFFVLGDNRANSFDSRNWGVLSRNLVVGRARMILWSSGTGSMEPHANAASRRRPAISSPALRVDRLFKTVQ
jgi:type IV secretory pathway protease TraF